MESSDLFPFHSFFFSLICINCCGTIYLFHFSCYSFLIYLSTACSLFTVLLTLGSQLLNTTSDWLTAARAFSAPLLCHNTKHFIRKQRSVLLAVSFKASYFYLKSSAWTVTMGLAWSSCKSKRKEKKAHKGWGKCLCCPIEVFWFRKKVTIQNVLLLSQAAHLISVETKCLVFENNVNESIMNSLRQTESWESS